MNMTKEQIGAAVNAGLELLGPESEIKIPVKMNDSVFLLRQLLIFIAQGRVALTPVERAPSPPAPEAPQEENE